MPPLTAAGSDAVPGPATGPEDDGDALVGAARRGDRAALAALHDRFAPVVHGILLSSLGPHDADDLTQDVFLRVIQRLDTLHDTRAFPAWLVSMTRNLAAAFFRSPRPPAPDGHDPPAPGPGPADRAEAEEVLAAVRSLPHAYAMPLLLRLVEGLTGPQIAARTDMTHGSVRVNLHRGMAMLRHRLRIGDGP
jgi:RNA polymerase sigma-70 factor (ECF subfamily)